MNGLIFVLAQGKRYGPYTADNVERFLVEKRLKETDFCYDADDGPLAVSIAEWRCLRVANQWPPRRRRRRTAAETVRAQREQLERDRAAFEAYRFGELKRMEEGVNGFSQSVFFSRPNSQNEISFHGRVLGLKGKVTRTEVKNAFRKTVGQCHPDRVQMLHPLLREVAEHQTKMVNAAYEFFRTKYNIE